MAAIDGLHAEMSDFETLMWTFEKNPKLSSNIATLSILDQPVDFESFTNTMERASCAYPRLRQRVVESSNPFSNPIWRLDPDFDVTRHFIEVNLGGAATRADLERAAIEYTMEPFDQQHPLWTFISFTGLRGSKGAILHKMHHTLTDGEGGLRLSLEFTDFARHPKPRTPVAAPVEVPIDAGAIDVSSIIGSSMSFLSHQMSSTFDTITHPGSLWETTDATVSTARGLAKNLSLTEGALSPVWNDRSAERVFATHDFSFALARRAAKRFGCTLNDLFVGGIAAAAGRYHQRVGQPVDMLRMAMPISTRSDKSTGGNMFNPAQMLIPTSPRMGNKRRLKEISTILTKAKSDSSFDIVGSLSGFINLLPASVISSSGGYLSKSIDLVTSNMRAAPFDLYLGGAKMLHNYPIGPLAGSACNVTTMSYRGKFNVGMSVDPSAVDDPALLASLMRDAYAELLDVS